VDGYIFFDDKLIQGNMQRVNYIFGGFLYVVTAIGNLVYSAV
jgi:hypothetical protein